MYFQPTSQSTTCFSSTQSYIFMELLQSLLVTFARRKLLFFRNTIASSFIFIHLHDCELSEEVCNTILEICGIWLAKILLFPWFCFSVCTHAVLMWWCHWADSGSCIFSVWTQPQSRFHHLSPAGVLTFKSCQTFNLTFPDTQKAVKVPYSCHVMCFSCEYRLLTPADWQQTYQVWWVSHGGGGGVCGQESPYDLFFIALLYSLHSALYSIITFINVQLGMDSLFFSVIGQGIQT